MEKDYIKRIPGLKPYYKDDEKIYRKEISEGFHDVFLEHGDLKDDVYLGSLRITNSSKGY